MPQRATGPRGPRRPRADGPPSAAGPAESGGLPARRLTLSLLEQVAERGRTLDDAEAGLARPLERMPARDRGFVRAAARETLRRWREIDALLGARLRRRPPKAAVRARLSLALMTAEILFLRTPAYAAIDMAVRLTKEKDPRLAGLVNAVGRRIAEDGSALAPAEAARRNTPDWLWDRLAADWGAETAQACAEAHLAGAPLDLTPKAGPAGAAALAARLGEEARATPTGSVRLGGAVGAVARLEGFDAGDWWVQDAAAALPARAALAPFGAAGPGRVIDLCAAPGGKTLQLAAAGAETAAVDASAARLARVQANLARTGLSATLIEADALAWRPAEPAPAVLLDAPCSALGTLRRHPEATLIRDGADLDAFTALQDRLLDAAWEMVAPGGWLVFCTCSPLKAEGEERVAALRARRPDAAPDPIGPEEIGDGALIREGALRALPSHWAETGGLDGFFAARLRKAS